MMIIEILYLVFKEQNLYLTGKEKFMTSLFVTRLTQLETANNYLESLGAKSWPQTTLILNQTFAVLF